MTKEQKAELDAKQQVKDPETLLSKDKNEKGEWTEMGKTAAIAVMLAMLIRIFLFEPFNIPSGSMVPTLLVGDYLFVSKYSYGYSRYSFPLGMGGFEGRIWDKEPERGDIVVFKLPSDPSIDYIKRIIGMPGDTIQMINGRLFINGERLERRATGLKQFSNIYDQTVNVTEYIETLPGGLEHTIYEVSDGHPLDNTKKVTVPEGHYFMMGDNRDNSRDSRVDDLVGFVPYDHLVGEAQFIFFSTDGKAALYEFWKWPFSIRYNRLFNVVGP